VVILLESLQKQSKSLSKYLVLPSSNKEVYFTRSAHIRRATSFRTCLLLITLYRSSPEYAYLRILPLGSQAKWARGVSRFEYAEVVKPIRIPPLSAVHMNLERCPGRTRKLMYVTVRIMQGIMCFESRPSSDKHSRDALR
jgi:hypothetical protein